jgi:hypothetical protein
MVLARQFSYREINKNSIIAKNTEDRDTQDEAEYLVTGSSFYEIMSPECKERLMEKTVSPKLLESVFKEHFLTP